MNALIMFLIAVSGYSLGPLAIDLLAANNHVFLSTVAIETGAIIPFIMYLYRNNLAGIINNLTWKDFYADRNFIFTCLSAFNVVPYLIAVQHVEIAVVAILVNAFPIMFILIRWINHREIFVFPKVFFACSGFLMVGIVLIVLSHENITSFEISGKLILGAFLSLLSAVLNSLSVCSLSWGEQRSRERPLVFSSACYVVSRIITVPIIVAIWLMLKQEQNSSSAFYLLALSSVLLFGIPGLLWRRVNHSATRLSINGLFFLIPSMSLIWLSIFTKVDVMWGPLWAGTALILLCNIMMNRTT